MRSRSSSAVARLTSCSPCSSSALMDDRACAGPGAARLNPNGKEEPMDAAQLQDNAQASDEDPLQLLVRARFEALAEWGMPLSAAHVIAQAVSVDIFDAVGLVRNGCPADLVLPILGQP